MACGFRCRGDPHRGSRQRRPLGYPARQAAVGRRTARHQPGRRLQQPQCRQARHHSESPHREGQGDPRAARRGLRRRDRELLQGRDGTLGVRLRTPEGHQAGHHLCFQLRLRAHRALQRIQELRARRAGHIGTDVHLGASRPAARRLGLFVHGPYRRLLPRHGDPAGAHPPPSNRRRPVGGSFLHRRRPDAPRPRPARLDGQRPSDAARGTPASEPQLLACHGAPRHLSEPGRR